MSADESVRGCSCGMADYGAPGHDGADNEPTRPRSKCRHCGTPIEQIEGWSGWFATTGPTDGHLGSRGVCDVAYHHEPEAWKS